MVRAGPDSPWRLRSVRPGRVLGPLELDFEALHPDLITVHRLDGRLRRGRVVETHEAWDMRKNNRSKVSSSSSIARHLTKRSLGSKVC